MTPSQRRIFMDLLRPKNRTPYIFILLIGISLALTMWTNNYYLALTSAILMASFIAYYLIQNLSDQKTYCHKPFNSYYRAIKKGRRIFFEAIQDDKRLNALHSYAIVSEDQDTYTLLIDHYDWRTYTAIVFKDDVLEDSNLLPRIEEKMKQHPDYFGL